MFGSAVASRGGAGIYTTVYTYMYASTCRVHMFVLMYVFLQLHTFVRPYISPHVRANTCKVCVLKADFEVGAAVRTHLYATYARTRRSVDTQ